MPSVYIQQFLDQGYNFLALDYLLAPETPLTEGYEELKKGIIWFRKEYLSTLELKTNDFILFGRSAGAYLALLLAADPDLPKPEKVISFYGYYSLKDPSFTKKNQYYQKYPAIPETLLSKMIGNKPIAVGPIQTRFSLYLYGRQSGNWLDFLGLTEEETEQFSLKESDLAKLPPTFAAHSQSDQDVPYHFGQKIANAIPNSVLFSVSNLEHDFDRDPSIPQTKEAYSQLMDWL